MKSVTYCLVEISQNNNGHCFEDCIFLLYMHCFENYVLFYKTCFVLKVNYLFWNLLCFDDLIYLMSYVLKALSNFTHESVLKTDWPTDQVSPRSDFPSLKKISHQLYKLLAVVKVAHYNFIWCTLVRWHTFHCQRILKLNIPLPPTIDKVYISSKKVVYRTW